MKNTRRFISAVMALAMVSAIAPMSAFAINQDDVAAGRNKGTMTATYDIDAKYTVTIPAGVNLDSENSVSATFEASDVVLESGQKIKVTLNSADHTTSGATFHAQTDKGDSTATYTISKGETAVAVGDVVAEFTENGEQSLTFSKAEGATYAGTHTETLTFGISTASASTPLDTNTTAWTAGTYAVPAGGLTYSGAITVSGDVTLVLTDGKTLTLNKGISIADGATLTVEGNGTMNVNGSNNSTASTVAGTGTLVLNNGTLNAKGGNGEGGFSYDEASGAAGGAAINGSVTINGGNLTAAGGNGGSVFGYYDFCSGGAGGAAITGDLTINGGNLTATGGNGGSVSSNHDYCSGGAGGAAITSGLTINGGEVTTQNGSAGTIGANCDDCSAGAGGKAVTGTETDNR